MPGKPFFALVASDREPFKRRPSRLRCLSFFRPNLELLENRLQPGDAFFGGFWGFGVLGLDAMEPASELDRGNQQSPDSFLLRENWELVHAGTTNSLLQVSLSEAGYQPASEPEGFSLGSNSGAPGNSVTGSGNDFWTMPTAQNLIRVPMVSVANLPYSGIHQTGDEIVGSVPRSDTPSQFQILSPERPNEKRLDPLLRSSSPVSANIFFDAGTGLVGIRGYAGDNTVQETIGQAGFLEVTIDGQQHSSNPASASFDSNLMGATESTVAGIHYTNGGGHDTLTLGSQNLAGSFTVSAPSAEVHTQDIGVGGRLAIEADRITVSGALHGRDISLSATGLISVETAGSLVARDGDNGGRIDVNADIFVTTGQLHADGANAGEVFVHSRNMLNAGQITADGNHGAVGIAFTGSYIDTTAAMTSGGHVTITGGRTGRLYSSGRHQATGQVGGTIDLLGREVVLNGATVDASGENGGGLVRIGGDFQGKNPAVTNAQTVTVTGAATIQANALQAGNGGRVVVWADQETLMDGPVSARGGSAGGDGGFIEVSGKGDLSFGGSGDACARSGKTGTLLLDPKDIIISEAPSGVFPQFNLIDPHPTAGGGFGTVVTFLNNGNVIVTNPNDDFGGTRAGAVYLIDGLSGALISSLVGGNVNDRVGDSGQFNGPSIVPLSNGNYAVRSLFWNDNRGSVTWGSRATGVNGVVSTANSLVGTNPNDSVGSVTVLPTGNYLVNSPHWNDNRGAVTWGNGATGVRGTVSAVNSLIGTNPNDFVGNQGITVLSNGNYVVLSPFWNGNHGAVTWGNGTAGVGGMVSMANSLVGSNVNDSVGLLGIVTLTDGNYVVRSIDWNDRRGAVTWGSGTGGISGTVSEANSLVGSHSNDVVGNITVLPSGNYVISSPNWNGARGEVTWASSTTGIMGVVSEANSLVGTEINSSTGQRVFALNTGNYVVTSPGWNGQRGAVTWGRGDTGITGTISEVNSLVGTHPNDNVGGFVGNGVTVLPNGNYVVTSLGWDGNRGAATWGNGTMGITGAVSETNSLVGGNPNDLVGGITVLPNGNFVVSSQFWNGQRGEATWSSGSAGVSGVVSEANSLVGSNPNDQVGAGITPLSNGNYLVRSPNWNGNRGAVTWGNGKNGVSGAVSSSNSLVGADLGDFVGGFNIVPLSNGNYLVPSLFWNANRGAVTRGNGMTGVVGVVSADNSLVGTQPNDQVGNLGAVPLSTGNYLVISGVWNRASGAVTFGNGTTGTTGPITPANSLVGDPGDQVGFYGGALLNNGNYVVHSQTWHGGRGAVTWGSGITGVVGLVSADNSLVGLNPSDLVDISLTTLSNGNYLIVNPFWNGARGSVTWASGATAITGAVSENNSLVGSNPYDLVGGGTFGGITLLTNGNYLVSSSNWNGNRGAITWGNGDAGVRGAVSGTNSLLGDNPGDVVGSGSVALLTNGNYVVLSPMWNGNRGAVTLFSGSNGQTLDGRGVITMQNSLVGRAPNAGLGTLTFDIARQSFLVPFVSDGTGRLTVGLTDPNQLTYARAQSQTVILTPNFLTHTLNSGTDVVLQASNDITVEDPITVHAGGKGGALTLQAGRSIILNASISTDNGPLTLIANDTLANGVVDSQRDPGNAFITMAGRTELNAGAGPMNIELRNGAGRTYTSSRSINLQAITAGSVNVVNNGPSTGSDVILGPVTSDGPQTYSSPNGTTFVSGNLTAADNPITFTDSVVVDDRLRIDAGSDKIRFNSPGAQHLQTGNGDSFGSVEHNGTGTLQLASPLDISWSFTNTAGIFDANDQPVTVSGLASLTSGTYRAGTAPQNFLGGLVIGGGTFTSSTGPMSVNGTVAITGGNLAGEGMVGPLTVVAGNLIPGAASPGILTVAGSVALFSGSTFTVRLNGPDPGTSYSQLVAQGPVFLGGSTLNLVLGFEPRVGSSFEILRATGPDPISGTFAGLDEGAIFKQGGFQFQITYHGGAGANSVVVTRVK